MRIRLLLAVTAATTLAACSGSPTAPQKLTPRDKPMADVVACRSGYHIATRADGSEYCEADGGAQFTTPSQTTTTNK